MIIRPPGGYTTDDPDASPQPLWKTGYNMRFRIEAQSSPVPRAETIGLWGKAKDIGDSPAKVDPNTWGPIRFCFNHPGHSDIASQASTGHILFGGNIKLGVAQIDPNSTAPTGNRYNIFDITPTDLTARVEDLTVLTYGKIPIQPMWRSIQTANAVFFNYANHVGPAAFSWDRNVANKAVSIPNVPMGGVGLTMSEDRHLILFGVPSAGQTWPGDHDTTFRWSDQERFEVWEPMINNLAGDLRLPMGQQILAGVRTSLGILCWTDVSIHRIRSLYDGLYVFGHETLGIKCGLISQQGWVESDGRVFWLGNNKTIYELDGSRPRELPCPIYNSTLKQVNPLYTSLIQGFSIAEHDEVGWYLPTGASPILNTKLVYNYKNGSWYAYKYGRVSFTDRASTMQPAGFDNNGQLYLHELEIGHPEVNAVTLENRPWSVRTSKFYPTAEEMERQTMTTRRLLIDRLTESVPGDEANRFDVQISGTEEIEGTVQTVIQSWGSDTLFSEPRIEGRTLQMELSQPAGSLSTYRFGDFNMALDANPRGER